jgi:hypothetical protein
MNRITITTLLLIFCAGPGTTTAAQPAPPSNDRAQVLKAEEDFRIAKLNNDTVALERLLADGYYGVNQWGAKRDKAEIIALFREFKTDSLTPADVTVRISGDLAVVDGIMTESGPGGKFSYLFLRVYLRRSGGWQLLSSTQMIPSNP